MFFIQENIMSSIYIGPLYFLTWDTILGKRGILQCMPLCGDVELYCSPCSDLRYKASCHLLAVEKGPFFSASKLVSYVFLMSSQQIVSVGFCLVCFFVFSFFFFPFLVQSNSEEISAFIWVSHSWARYSSVMSSCIWVIFSCYLFS